MNDAPLKHLDRLKQINELRQSGMSRAAIGKKLNMSAARVAQLERNYEHHKSLVAERLTNKLLNLPIMTFNALTRAQLGASKAKLTGGYGLRYGKPVTTVGDLAQRSADELLSFYSFSKKGLASCEALLIAEGYSADSSRLLADIEKRRTVPKCPFCNRLLPSKT